MMINKPTATRRALDLMEALCHYPLTGIANKALAERVQSNPVYVIRDMQALIDKGWARKDEDGRYFPTAQFSRLTFKILEDLKGHQRRLDDLSQSFTNPNL